MWTIDSPELARNYGFMNEAEQQALLDARVALAGVGGDGFQLGQKLARQGVQSFSVADPEVFEAENANRVPGATTMTYGLSKALVFAQGVYDINPGATVDVFTDGVTPDNVGEFMEGADLVLDESELTHLEIGTAIAREARRRDIPDLMVMNVGFSAIVTSFDPKSRHTFERFMGIPKGMPLDEVAERQVDFSRCLPYIPHYGDVKTLIAVQEGEASLPSIAEGVDIASGVGTTQAKLHLMRKAGNHRPEPVWAPKVGYMDAYTLQSGITRHPRLSHYRHLIPMVARSALHLNPEASYTDDDRHRRGQE